MIPAVAVLLLSFVSLVKEAVPFHIETNISTSTRTGQIIHDSKVTDPWPHQPATTPTDGSPNWIKGEMRLVDKFGDNVEFAFGDVEMLIECIVGKCDENDTVEMRIGTRHPKVKSCDPNDTRIQFMVDYFERDSKVPWMEQYQCKYRNFVYVLEPLKVGFCNDWERACQEETCTNNSFCVVSTNVSADRLLTDSCGLIPIVDGLCPQENKTVCPANVGGFCRTVQSDKYNEAFFELIDGQDCAKSDARLYTSPSSDVPLLLHEAFQYRKGHSAEVRCSVKSDTHGKPINCTLVGRRKNSLANITMANCVEKTVLDLESYMTDVPSGVAKLSCTVGNARLLNYLVTVNEPHLQVQPFLVQDMNGTLVRQLYCNAELLPQDDFRIEFWWTRGVDTDWIQTGSILFINNTKMVYTCRISLTYKTCSPHRRFEREFTSRPVDTDSIFANVIVDQRVIKLEGFIAAYDAFGDSVDPYYRDNTFYIRCRVRKCVPDSQIFLVAMERIKERKNCVDTDRGAIFKIVESDPLASIQSSFACQYMGVEVNVESSDGRFCSDEDDECGQTTTCAADRFCVLHRNSSAPARKDSKRCSLIPAVGRQCTNYSDSLYCPFGYPTLCQAIQSDRHTITFSRVFKRERCGIGYAYVMYGKQKHYYMETIQINQATSHILLKCPTDSIEYNSTLKCYFKTKEQTMYDAKNEVCEGSIAIPIPDGLYKRGAGIYKFTCVFLREEETLAELSNYLLLLPEVPPIVLAMHHDHVPILRCSISDTRLDEGITANYLWTSQGSSKVIQIGSDLTGKQSGNYTCHSTMEYKSCKPHRYIKISSKRDFIYNIVTTVPTTPRREKVQGSTPTTTDASAELCFRLDVVLFNILACHILRRWFHAPLPLTFFSMAANAFDICSNPPAEINNVFFYKMEADPVNCFFPAPIDIVVDEEVENPLFPILSFDRQLGTRMCNHYFSHLPQLVNKEIAEFFRNYIASKLNITSAVIPLGVNVTEYDEDKNSASLLWDTGLEQTDVNTTDIFGSKMHWERPDLGQNPLAFTALWTTTTAAQFESMIALDKSYSVPMRVFCHYLSDKEPPTPSTTVPTTTPTTEPTTIPTTIRTSTTVMTTVVSRFKTAFTSSTGKSVTTETSTTNCGAPKQRMKGSIILLMVTLLQ